MTVQEDGRAGRSDEQVLVRATELGRLTFLQDADMLRIANALQTRGASFAGIAYAHSLKITIGQCVNDWQLICELGMPEEFESRVEFLPY